MGLYKRKEKGRESPIWWMSFTDKNKKSYRHSTCTKDRKLAEKILAKVQTQIVENKFFDKEAEVQITFRELADRYVNKYGKIRDPHTIKHLLPFFGGRLLSEIEADDIEEYIDTRLAKGAKEATIYQEFALGRRMFNIARKKWRKETGVRENPFSDAGFPAYDNKRTRWLRVEEEILLLAAASPNWVKDVITFAIHTGCRRGEILSVDWRQNIDMQRRTITVQASKGGLKKTIPMSRVLYEMLEKRSKIVSISGKVFDVKVSTLKDAFDRAVIKAKIEDLHFHDLRHTFGTRLVQAGIDLYRVQILMGHKTIKMTERYAHHSPESLKPASTAMDSYYDFHDSVTSGENAVCLNVGKSFKINYGSV